MDKKTRGQHAERLLADDVLREAFDEVRGQCLGIMASPKLTDAEVLEARRDLVALERVKSRLDSFVADLRLAEKRDRDRVSDRH